MELCAKTRYGSIRGHRGQDKLQEPKVTADTRRGDGQGTHNPEGGASYGRDNSWYLPRRWAAPTGVEVRLQRQGSWPST